jgi:hypothetical protein
MIKKLRKLGPMLQKREQAPTRESNEEEEEEKMFYYLGICLEGLRKTKGNLS